jgi:hypothetical protein
MTDLSKIILASLVSDKQIAEKPSVAKRKPNYFGAVNAKFETLLANQIGADKSKEEVKRRIIDECINRVDGITRKEYLTTLRDTMCKYVYYLPFLMECRNLGFDAFAVAQNIIIQNRHGKVAKIGLRDAFRGKESVLKEALFTESELAEAKFGSVENPATDTQKTQLSALIENAMKILPAVETV